MTYAPRALIAEDEPLLAEDLRQALARAWPELQIAAMVGDGLSAARQAPVSYTHLTLPTIYSV